MKGERDGQNVTRSLLFDYISEHPGVTFQMLINAFSLKESTLRYHLNYLQLKEEIFERKRHGLNTYFSNMVKRSSGEKGGSSKRPTYVRNERLLNVIKGNPGITRDGLKMMIGLNSKELTTGLSQLKESGLIWGRENGGTMHYEIVTKERLLDEVLVSLIRKLVDGEMDEKTFLALKTEIEKERRED